MMLKQISELGKSLKSSELKTINGGGAPNNCYSDQDCDFGRGWCNGFYCIYEMV